MWAVDINRITNFAECLQVTSCNLITVANKRIGTTTLTPSP